MIYVSQKFMINANTERDALCVLGRSGRYDKRFGTEETKRRNFPKVKKLSGR